MKRNLLLLMLTALLSTAFSCKKESADPKHDESPDYFISFKANGVKQSYSGEGLVYALSLRLAGTEASQVIVQGRQKSDDLNSNAIFMVITDVEAVRTGIDYHLSDQLEWPEQNQSTPSVYGSYYNQEGRQYFAQLQQVASLPFVVRDAATVRFSKVSKQEVHGTFTMNAYTNYPALQELVITEGEFFVSILASSGQ